MISCTAVEPKECDQCRKERCSQDIYYASDCNQVSRSFQLLVDEVSDLPDVFILFAFQPAHKYGYEFYVVAMNYSLIFSVLFFLLLLESESHINTCHTGNLNVIFDLLILNLVLGSDVDLMCIHTHTHHEYGFFSCINKKCAVRLGVPYPSFKFLKLCKLLFIW